MTMTKQEMTFVEDIFRAAANHNLEVATVNKQQQLARTLLSDMTVPTRKQEDWKYFNFDFLQKNKYELLTEAKTLNEAEIAKYRELVSKVVFPETLENRIVTLNGAYIEELSCFNKSNGLETINFTNAQALEARPELQEVVAKHFGKHTSRETNFFKLCNTALLNNGFLLNVAKGTKIEKTLHVIHISNTNSFNQTRSLINIEANSSLNILVSYIGLDDAKYFTNAAIEVNLDQNARLKLNKIQEEATEAIQLYDLNAELARDSNFEFNSFNFGGASSRDDIKVNINGENAHAAVNGLYVQKDDKTSHHRIHINHKIGYSTSEQLYKGILYDRARAEFNGLVTVAKDAQQTNAEQLNQNLLMSQEAHVDTRPQLDIYADDVKCAHGATVGQLSEDEIFYLESRGISKEEAKTMITYSFCDELIQKIDLSSARKYIAKLAIEKLETVKTSKKGDVKKCI